MRKPISLIFVLVSTLASATSMQEVDRTALKVQFANHDEAEVACDLVSSTCRVLFRVNGKPFAYSAGDLHGHSPLPEAIYLFSGSMSGREKYFSFHVRIDCPKDYKRVTAGNCFASGLVIDGKLSDVGIIDY